MTLAYVDSSAVVAIGFEEPLGLDVADRLNAIDEVSSSNLLEAEVRSAFARERRQFQISLIDGIKWIAPGRQLGTEMLTVLEHGYLRGADLWHVAVALFASPDPSKLIFVTLDDRQREVAGSIGFQV